MQACKLKDIRSVAEGRVSDGNTGPPCGYLPIRNKGFPAIAREITTPLFIRGTILERIGAILSGKLMSGYKSIARGIPRISYCNGGDCYVVCGAPVS
jgi:hypothetical protein